MFITTLILCVHIIFYFSGLLEFFFSDSAIGYGSNLKVGNGEYKFLKTILKNN